jgi:hypothetical protein
MNAGKLLETSLGAFTYCGRRILIDVRYEGVLVANHLWIYCHTALIYGEMIISNGEVD